MIRDGWGDHPERDEMEALILEKERLLQIQVSERNRDPNLRDDLINEARITVWRVLEKHPDASPAYVHTSSGNRIKEIVSGGIWFGMQGRQGLERDPLRRSERDSLDDPDFLIEASSPDVMDDLLMAYHEGEILEAIRSLPPNHQAYVILRFWGGWRAGEMEPVVGVKSINQSRMWKDSIQPVLAERLKHLVDA